MSLQLSDSNLVKYAKSAFKEADGRISKIGDPNDLKIKGQTGIKNMCLMNCLCSLPGINYLEIGLFNGLTFACALKHNTVNAIGIDNWSEFGGSREMFDLNMRKNGIGSNKVNIIQADCFSDFALDSCEKLLGEDKIDVYLYDGGHSEEDHRRAITHYDRFMRDTFILVVDDWQQLDVQRGTLLSINDMDYEILWENHCRSVNDDADNWWCGTYLSVLRKII